jgi:uncharacterized protein (TIGR02246 family)
MGIFSVISWLVFGLIVGAIARFLMPGRQGMTWFMTALLGIVGSVIGGVLSWLIFGTPDGQVNAAGWMMSIVGAMLLVFFLRPVEGRPRCLIRAKRKRHLINFSRDQSMIANIRPWLPVLLLNLLSTGLRADEPAVRQTVASYIEAFNKKDLKTLAGMWAVQATYTDRETSERTEGRDAIVKDIAASFEEHPDARLAGRIDRVRLIKPDVASIEGQTSIGAPDEDPTLSNFSAILINENGKWLIDSIDEIPTPQPATAESALKDLQWLVGHWVDESKDVRVDTTFRWTASRAFLLRSFSVETADGDTEQGTQIIGWDPRSKEIRSWTFNSDGSFGDGTWSRSGDDWLIKSSQTNADGQAASGTYVLTRTDNDTINLRLIGHELEGEPQPASPSVKMVRVAAADAPAAEATNAAPVPVAPAPAAPATSVTPVTSKAAAAPAAPKAPAAPAPKPVTPKK